MQSFAGTQAFQHIYKQPGEKRRGEKKQGSEKVCWFIQAGKDEGQLQRTAEGLYETEWTLKRKMKMDFNTYWSELHRKKQSNHHIQNCCPTEARSRSLISNFQGGGISSLLTRGQKKPLNKRNDKEGNREHHYATVHGLPTCWMLCAVLVPAVQ